MATTTEPHLDLPAGVEIAAPLHPGYDTILTRDALAFVATLVRAFAPRHAEPLAARPERHARVDGAVIPGSLFDFGLFFFHNAKAQLERGTGPYFYLPKLESHREARWWNEVFVRAQDLVGIPRGTIRATVLIETLPAA